jgi:tetratricopeptide (TPR) repeat protein
MIRAFTLVLKPWRSVIGASADWNQAEEADCAIADYTKAIESNPNNAAAYLRRGIAHLEAFALNSAIADFTRAIELNPSNASAITNRGTAHYEKGEHDRAMADFTRAIEINPKSAFAYCGLGWTYEAIGDELQAIAHYQKALELDPSLEAARDNLKLLGATPEREPFHRQTKPRGTEGLTGIFPSRGSAGV